MSALAMAMLLTGAGAVQDHKPPGPLPPPMPMIAPPAPPAPRALPTPAPSRIVSPQRVRPNPNAYFSMDDYPASALRANEQGTTSFRLTIGANGRVTDCQVTASSGSSALDQATCRIMRSRARYVPARDFLGIPTTGADSGRITWRLPVDDRAGIPHPERPAVARAPLASYFPARDNREALRAADSGLALIRVVAGPDGRVIACDVDEASGPAAIEAAACRILRARARYAPARGAGGAPVCDVDAGTVERALLPGRRVPPSAVPRPMRPRRPIGDQLAPGVCPGRTP